jgi:hypothetical protein
MLHYKSFAAPMQWDHVQLALINGNTHLIDPKVYRQYSYQYPIVGAMINQPGANREWMV